eukprot:CAMPEP_0176014778 /NCGR_PEP_ID=MMETSP0120_2-20121206/6997_1 /TAXON_ID=160619 /ORGANISM="Kryptoperidinium foliaceum, Strain CCMP 1326" /LENGTH=133 /DNA_ID=CAMNT_0017347727 /DNA_START=453 /DNA_END=856 /DNA_ORIENTATION=+
MSKALVAVGAETSPEVEGADVATPLGPGPTNGKERDTKSKLSFQALRESDDKDSNDKQENEDGATTKPPAPSVPSEVNKEILLKASFGKLSGIGAEKALHHGNNVMCAVVEELSWSMHRRKCYLLGRSGMADG